MSRCYPYPPPGYERRANVELGLSPKKEKHKCRDKKKKRRKDSESNGGDLPRDLDKRSKKPQQTGVFRDFSLANGSLPETRTTSSEAVHEKFAQSVQCLNSNAEVPSAGVLAINCQGIQKASKQGSQLSLVSVAAVCNSNGATANEAPPSSNTHAKSAHKLKREDSTQYIPHVEMAWSTLDDQEWLFHHNNRLQSVPRNKLDEIPSPQVWAEAVLLPSVSVYALPYVVPD